MSRGREAELAAEFDQVSVEGGEFERFAGETVLEHRGAGTRRIGGEFGKNVGAIDAGARGGGDGESFGEQFFGPAAVEGFAENFKAAAGECSEGVGDAVVEHFAPGGGQEVGSFLDGDGGVAEQLRQGGAGGDGEVRAGWREGLTHPLLRFDVDVGQHRDAGLGEPVLNGGQNRGVYANEGRGGVVGFGREKSDIGGGADVQIVGKSEGRETLDVEGTRIAAGAQMDGMARAGKVDGEPGTEIAGADDGDALRHLRIGWPGGVAERARLHSMARVCCEFEIYTFQIDFARHVSNIVYIQWLEVGRLKLLEEVGLPVGKAAERGITPIVAATSIVYQRPVYLGDRVRLEAWLGDFGKASAMVHYQLTNQRGEQVAEATQRGLFVRIADGKPMRLGEEDRLRFAPYVERRAPVRID